MTPETLPLLTFVFGVFTGAITTGVIGGIYVKRKLDKMKQSGLGGLGDMMGEMAESMAEGLDDLPEDDSSDE